MITIVQYISLVLLLLVTGIFWGTWFSLSRSIEKTSPETFLENGKLIIKNLAVPMRIAMPLTILTMIADVWWYPVKHGGGFYLTIAAVILMVLTLLITVTIEVPIDNQIKYWTVSSLPEEWKALRSRWQFYHTVRTFTAVISFSLLLAGALFY